jgi:carbamate kinase
MISLIGLTTGDEGVRAVIGLGGNALLRRGERPEADIQRRNVIAAARSISRIAANHELVVTHGNGPQVGLLALQSECLEGVSPYPLDLLNAETEGMLGYLMERELRNRLPGRKVAGLLTMVEVAADDPAFLQPTKPIGPFYSRQEAQRLQHSRGWKMAVEGESYRRVVPSPEPRRIVELPTIELLLEAGALVICAGGGGIPVVMTEAEGLVGVEGVIDKDRATALLAAKLNARRLLLLTDVDAVYRGWGSDKAEPLGRVTPLELEPISFAPGSMGPKVEAACRFVKETGGQAGIGLLQEAEAVFSRDAGTLIVPE